MNGKSFKQIPAHIIHYLASSKPACSCSHVLQQLYDKTWQTEMNVAVPFDSESESMFKCGHVLGCVLVECCLLVPLSFVNHVVKVTGLWFKKCIVATLLFVYVCFHFTATTLELLKVEGASEVMCFH